MPRTLYLIDGHAQIFRAYFAIRGGMSSPVTGEPTHAVFAFAGMLLKLFSQFKPEYVVMAIDLPGKTFRDEMYDQYKANRPPPPEDFHSQEQRIFEMTKMFGIPVIGIKGAEADDVIATIARRVLDDPSLADMDIRVVSRDKDLEQLLGERVCMFDIHKDETIDVAKLLADKGITPAQVIDMLTLTGDTVDNVPGVDGIGPKTAVMLLQQFGSLDGILANIDKIKGKRRENIEAARERLSLSRRLVTLKDDVEMDFGLDRMKLGEIDTAGLRDLFGTMGFRRHISDLERLTGSPAKPAVVAAPAKPSRKKAEAAPVGEGFPEFLFGAAQQPAGDSDSPSEPANESEPPPANLTTAQQYDYRAVTTAEQLRELVATLKSQQIISVDTETVGLGRHARVCGISLAWEHGKGVYVPIESPDPRSHLDRKTVYDALRPVLEDVSIGKTGHNLKYDATVLRGARADGIRLRGIVFDSMIAAYLLEYPSRGLDALAESLLAHRMIPISQLIGSREQRQTTMDTVPLDQITPYAAEDADMALRLHHLLAPKLREAGMEELASVEMPLVEALADMEANGICVQPDELLRQKDALTGRIEELREAIYEAAGAPFNLDSPKQLADVLFNQLMLPVGKRTKSGPSTDVEVLEKLAAREDLPPEKTKVPTLIVEYRQLSKLVNTYLDNLRESIHKDDGRIHASFQQLGAATGRLSSGGPNLQNIPVRTEIGRQIRKAFVAKPGYMLICADYSQIELRLLAHLSDDVALIDAFNRDMDIHTAVAAQVFNTPPEQVTGEQRAKAKIINFGIVYGVTSYGLARRIEGLDEHSAKALIADYRRRFSGIDRFLHQCIEEALSKGYVTTILGRRRKIPQIQSTNGNTRSLGERLAINTVVQGSATGDLIKKAMVNLYRRIHRDNLPMRMLVQIHDELIFEAPADIAASQGEIVREEMEQAMKLKVPLKVDVGIGPDWMTAK